MVLFLPEASCFKKWQASVIQMRLVLFLQAFPYLLALVRRHLRMVIDLMLKLIYHAAVRYKHDSVFQMHLGIFLCLLFPEKEMVPWLGEKFHGHGVDFRRLHSDIRMFPDRILRRQISLERMSALVGHDIHISAGSVKVRKDKRRLVIRKIGHIAADCLRLSSEDIHQLIFHHKVKEFPGFRRKLPVHLLSRRQDLFRCTFRLWISLRSEYLLVRPGHNVHSKTISALLVHFFRKRHKNLFHLTAQIFHLFPSIAVSLHSQIAQRCIGFKSKLPRLLRAVFHQPVIQLIQFLSDALKKFVLLFRRLSADSRIRAGQIRSQQRKVQSFPVPVDLRACQQFFILCHQGVLLLHQRDHLVGHCFHSHFHIFERNRSDLLLQLCPVWGFKQ